jgi:hypothetical protein
MGLVVHEGDGMREALFLTGSTFDTFLRIDYFRSLAHPLMDFARTDFDAITAVRTRVLINLGMHSILILEHMTRGETIVPRDPRYCSWPRLH